jgi:hypothetical protein
MVSRGMAKPLLQQREITESSEARFSPTRPTTLVARLLFRSSGDSSQVSVGALHRALKAQVL